MINLKKCIFSKYMPQGGRSMVEMLGVLAVIGVLSIGGIAGYHTAMSYHKANIILDDVNKRAILVATSIATNGAKIAGEMYPLDLAATNGLDQTVTAKSDNDAFFC